MADISKNIEAIRNEAIQAFPILEFFKYDHLPPHLQLMSKPFSDLAFGCVGELGKSRHKAEIAAGLRKLLEAKDCLVRASLP